MPFEGEKKVSPFVFSSAVEWKQQQRSGEKLEWKKRCFSLSHHAHISFCESANERFEQTRNRSALTMSDERRKKSPKVKSGDECPNDASYETYLSAKKRRSPASSRTLAPPSMTFRLSDDDGDEQVRIHLAKLGGNSCSCDGEKPLCNDDVSAFSREPPIWTMMMILTTNPMSSMTNHQQPPVNGRNHARFGQSLDRATDVHFFSRFVGIHHWNITGGAERGIVQINGHLSQLFKQAAQMAVSWLA